MSLQEVYKETTGNKPESESSNNYPYLCGTGTYSDEYVKWLESKVINYEPIHRVSLFEEGECIIVCDDLITIIDDIDEDGKIWFYNNKGTRSWADVEDIKHHSS